MSAILEAIDGEIASLELRLESLRSLRKHAAEIEEADGQMALASVPDPEAEPAPPAELKPKQAVKPPPDAPSEAAKAKPREAGRQTREAMLAEIRKHPEGIAPRDIAEALDRPWGGLKSHAVALLNNGKIRAEGSRKSRRYLPAEADLAPVDANGAKTGPERRVLAALESAPGALTTSEVAANAEVNIGDAGRILQGLSRRQLVRALPRKSETERPRWELPARAEAA